MTLADEFRAAQLAFCEELRDSDDGYTPTRFEPIVRAGTGDDAVAFATRLVEHAPEDGTAGFRRMLQIGRGQQTLEYQVLLERWRPLFDRRTLDVARWRLQQNGIAPPSEG
ncbi:hypothetical protein [Pseudonocardia sp. ICBG601]|uniref:hypothetical protein n=1 Tax=Pseudonocardia sp. ICBG601 TaxID=2846759 RepID=UPI001CF70BED|nr:hypothetical protein [Pseudonocardia sp. ICBG601]